MALLRLSICIAGVYSTFLLWAVAQESLSTPFPSTSTLRPDLSTDYGRSSDQQADVFPSPLFLNFAQAFASCLSALTYLVFNSWRDGSWGDRAIGDILGLGQAWSASGSPGETAGGGQAVGTVKANAGGVRGIDGRVDGIASGLSSQSTVTIPPSPSTAVIAPGGPWRKSLPFLLVQVSLFQTLAGPIGFMALRHISYPTMVLGKSCKLIPVLVLNVVLYRRRFSSHKYLVVGLVTVGISMFMLFGKAGTKAGSSDSAWGLTLLGINLLVDGLTNSTQDQIFSMYPDLTGQQMMFSMALLTQFLLLPFILLPLPTHPLTLLHHLPTPFVAPLQTSVPASLPPTLHPSALSQSLAFLLSHPTALLPLLAYALLGGLGQLFIFETIQHFGSLTLTMVTVTRKLFTMLLSVALFEHKLSYGQWLGVTVVFSGIAVEAGIKRRDVMRRARRDSRYGDSRSPVPRSPAPLAKEKIK